MSFRERMHPERSRAETTLEQAFKNAGIADGMETNPLVILKWTYPDFLWREKRKALYLDGEAVHKGKALERDEENTNLLEIFGFDVKRIRYRGRPSEKRLLEWVTEVKEWLET